MGSGNPFMGTESSLEPHGILIYTLEIIQKCEEILDRLRTLDGVFCPTEPTTSALLIALRKHGLSGRVRIAGFDSSPQLLQALEAGEIDSLVLQEPRVMAYRRESGDADPSAGGSATTSGRSYPSSRDASKPRRGRTITTTNAAPRVRLSHRFSG